MPTYIIQHCITSHTCNSQLPTSLRSSYQLTKYTEYVPDHFESLTNSSLALKSTYLLISQKKFTHSLAVVLLTNIQTDRQVQYE